jgi:hypothetical protein
MYHSYCACVKAEATWEARSTHVGEFRAVTRRFVSVMMLILMLHGIYMRVYQGLHIGLLNCVRMMHVPTRDCDCCC